MVVKGPDALEILNEKETLKFTMHEDKLRLNGQSLDMTDFYVSNLDLYLFTSTSSFRFRNEVHGVKYDEKKSEVNILAPMPGVIHAIDVSEGTEVFVGDRVAILEAMKMQHELIAGKDGKIGKIYFSTGEQVSADDLIMEIKE
jgi:biotin carboxyl carrier protein